MEKICTDCGYEKPIDEFYYNARLKRYFNACKICKINYSTQYRLKNIDKVKEYQKAWQKNNRVYLREYNRKRSKDPKIKAKKCAQYRLYAKRHPDRVRATRRRKNRKLRSTVVGKLHCRMSDAIRRHLRNGKNGTSWKNLVPYSPKQLKRRLKQTMPEGYTWDDFMSGALHIDHKLPLSSFTFTDTNDLNFQRAWALSNLQLLPADENIKKSDSVESGTQILFPGL